jgi:hypothetical protein
MTNMEALAMDSLLATPRQSFTTQSTATLVSTPRPSIASTLVGTRPSLAPTQGYSSDGKRPSRLKETQFQVKYGHKHHSYDPEKAPYPVSYDRHVLELESLDSNFIMYLADSVSMVPGVKENPPERALDLGCGTGSWVISAAKEWPETHFVRSFRTLIWRDAMTPWF